MELAVIGAGSWGTALADLAARNGHQVRIWARKQEVCDSINTSHVNCRYLSDSVLDEKVVAYPTYAQVVTDADAVCVVTPSSVLRDVARELCGLVGPETPIVICSKGVEMETGLLPVDIFEQELGGAYRLAVLTGPNHAEEVILGRPAGTLVASSQESTAALFQEVFGCPTFRTYISRDVIGAEVCAAFKNVVAIATGASYGYGLGDNTAALLMTRGLAEMSRLVIACGGESVTCMGLAGMGDLLATCMSEHSRNRTFGYKMAQGMTLEEYKAQTHMVVEGALACKTIGALAKRLDVELPICDVVRGIVWEGKGIQETVSSLMSRSLKPEFY
ncbi:MAG: NAD(P)-dependent glycerol-3-phosphate dehydrogenase [Eggerthellales bacterium]|nr:NAD(P)-dependent glycerol-3-phosphate dehydrogenase [Eggerthellales bacterium]